MKIVSLIANISDLGTLNVMELIVKINTVSTYLKDFAAFQE